MGRRPRRVRHHVPLGRREWARSGADGNAHLGGIYNPANHRIAIGNPRAGGGEHGSFPGMRIRNVRIGAR